MASIVARNFGDLIDIVSNRAKIAFERQPKDLDFVKNVLNEWYMNIATERSWTWRQFDRTINFKKALTDGTVAVTNGSREVVFTGLTLDSTFKGRSLKIRNQRELYRIIGVDTSFNSAILEANYVGDDDAAATGKVYQYAFPLAPDCDTVNMVYVDDEGLDYYDSKSGELQDMGRFEFNRHLSNIQSYVGPPYGYNIDGNFPADALPPLDVMVADYDFLGGNPKDKTQRIRFIPIEPDRERVIHVNYSRMAEPMGADDDQPIIPMDDRWVLVHFALAEWHSRQGSGTMADRERAIAQQRLAEMRQEWRRTQQKPKFIFDARNYRRQHRLDSYRLFHKLSRLNEQF